ncbi:MAG: ADP-ribosylglycohydrolase family protein [Chromatiales bacterium]
MPTTARTPPKKGTALARKRFLGCLLGGAVGDALGASVEFMDLGEIRDTFGSGGIRDYAPAYGRLGAITDDTQMTLFTAEGLLRGWVRQRVKGIASYPVVTTHAYLRWLLTQGEEPRCHPDADAMGWLYSQQELHSRRAPGNTCLSALRGLKDFTDRAVNDSKGCGGVMRVAPVGLFAWHRRQRKGGVLQTFDLAVKLAAITHGHPSGQLPAGVLAVLIMGLIDGLSLAQMLTVARACLERYSGHRETLQALDVAEELASSAARPDDAIARLGKGWVAEEALAISIYCALVAKGFEEGVVLAVSHSGDSDSTGAITGNLLGAMHGLDDIPKRWLDPLELRGVIAELADDLFSFPSWKIGGASDDRSIHDRYPGN